MDLEDLRLNHDGLNEENGRSGCWARTIGCRFDDQIGTSFHMTQQKIVDWKGMEDSKEYLCICDSVPASLCCDCASYSENTADIGREAG